MTFHIYVGSNLYIEKSIYSIEILMYFLISRKDSLMYLLISAFYSKRREKNLFYAVLGSNAKERVTLSKATQGPRGGYCTQTIPKLVCELI